MMINQNSAVAHAKEIFEAAIPIIAINGVGGRKWKRNVAKGARIGPWLPASYDIVNKAVWIEKNPCLYLVAGTDGVIRYVGISRNRLKDRWRESPAYDAETMALLPKNHLFHSQCWKHIEAESISTGKCSFEVRCINGDSLLRLIERLGPPLSAFAALKGDNEGIVAGVERWLCNNKSVNLVPWNVAMTR